MAPNQYDPRYLQGIESFNAQDYYSAHEVWELLWRDCPEEPKRFYHGLIQAAVALYHYQRGNQTGAARLCQAGRAKMTGYPERYQGLNWPKLWDSIEGVVFQNELNIPRIDLGVGLETLQGLAMHEDDAALAKFTGEARLFPLPNLVMMPHALQGLHIFEPRYREMTADALASDQLIALVLLLPGGEDEQDELPMLADVACLGRITHHEEMPDGRFNIRLKGIGRLRIIEEVDTDKPYRIARTEVIPEMVPADLPRLTELRRELAKSILPRFEPSGPAYLHLLELFQGEMSLGQLCDTLTYALPISLELKQHLLGEAHVDTRAEILTHALRIPTPNPNRKFPPEFSAN